MFFQSVDDQTTTAQFLDEFDARKSSQTPTARPISPSVTTAPFLNWFQQL
jgi:hypothetical protein